MHAPLTPEELDLLRHQHGTATRLWGRMFSGLTAVTFREKGEAAVHKLWHEVLTSHQDERYHEGLTKLGIDKDPPAIAAAKYHYYTNLIGGLSMEYAEESPRKAWVRYTAPMWLYDGVAMLAMPGNLRRTILGSWHPRNGEMMGCPRLGWVATKFIMEGDPYDEGYFFEHDHELKPEERYRIEHVTSTPPHDPIKAPQLNSEEWPEARLIRARRNFSSRYLKSAVEVLFRQQGEVAALNIIAQSMRLLAIQYTHELSEKLGREGNGAREVAKFFSDILTCCSQEFTVEDISESRQRLVVGSFIPFDQAPENFRHALFAFQEMCTKLINGNVRITRKSNDNAQDIWEIEDTGGWLW